MPTLKKETLQNDPSLLCSSLMRGYNHRSVYFKLREMSLGHLRFAHVLFVSFSDRSTFEEQYD